jgi:predicted alpha-1,2-mannosidase
MWLALLLACSKDPSGRPIDDYDPLAWVDVFVGTGGDGFGVGSETPAATVPFGMVKLGPDTRGNLGDIEYAHCAGYRYDDDQITAFSHAHAPGIGIADYGMIGFLPRDGWDPAWTEDATRAVGFDKASETGSPGYYAVTLADGTRVELSATEHGGVHRYTFADGADPVVVIDLGHTYGNTSVSEARVARDGDTVTGFEHLIGSYSGRFGGLQVHFEAMFSPAPTGSGTWTDPAAPVDGSDSADGTIAGMWLQFPPGTTTVEAHVALSYVDGTGADRNLSAELLPSVVDFDEVRTDAEAAWREELGGVRVSGGTDAQKTVFHTAQYHAYQMPTRFSDTDGRYRGIDGEIHTADFPYYTDFSMWDTFRTLHPWLILARPTRQADMNRSLVAMADDVGSFDRWPMGHGVTGGMVGTPTDQILSESWQKGVRDWDVDKGWDYSWAHATGPVSPVGREGVDGYVSRGYVAWEDDGGPAAVTLEYSWSDAALARWAAGLGKDAEHAQLLTQADSWKNTWDADRGFFVGRYADGSFTADFDPDVWADDYVEGDAWQYLWMVPQDVPGMIDVQHAGDRDAFLARFDQFFADSEAADDTAFPDVIYWHGNEPDIHDGWLGSLAGAPDHSAGPLRWILDHKYADSPAGLDGNDDGGTLSAWALWAMIGVFPVAGTDVYAIGAPVFDRVEVDLPSDETLVIRAPGTSESAMYVQSATLGGDDLATSTVTHQELVDGEELILTMGEAPAGWGSP